MKSILELLGLKTVNKTALENLKKQVKEGRDKDIQELKRATHKFRMLVDEGSVEITIRNIKKITKELK